MAATETPAPAWQRNSSGWRSSTTVAGQVTLPSADNPNPDWSGVSSQIVDADPDLVWTTVNPTALASIMAGAIGQGYDGLWSGNVPSFSYQLLGTEAAPLLDQYYITSGYTVTWGEDVPGMVELAEAMTAGRPDLPPSDAYVFGWTEAMTTHAILEQAAANGDMTRAGIVAAANEVTVDYNGLAPTQTWSGEPNDYIVRETYMYDVSLEDFDLTPMGEGEGDTGTVLLEGPFTGELAANFHVRRSVLRTDRLSNHKTCLGCRTSAPQARPWTPSDARHRQSGSRVQRRDPRPARAVNDRAGRGDRRPAR